MTSKSIINDKTLLNNKDEKNSCIDYLPLLKESIIYRSRGDQLTLIYDFITNSSNEVENVLYIYGSYGLGKTLSVKTVLDSIESNNSETELLINHINGLDVKKQSNFINEIRKIVDKITKLKNKVNRKNSKKNTKKVITQVIVVDEFDAITTLRNNNIYETIAKTIEETRKHKYKMKIILISNKLASNIIIRNTNDIKIKILNYEPYTKQQIIHIIRDYLQQKNIGIRMEDKALEYMALQISTKYKGDIRKVMDIVDTLNSKRLNTKANKVEISHVIETMNLLNSHRTVQSTRSSEINTTVNIHHYMYLLAVIMSMKRTNKNSVDTITTIETYRALCMQTDLVEPLDKMQLQSIMEYLETNMNKIEIEQNTRKRKNMNNCMLDTKMIKLANDSHVELNEVIEQIKVNMEIIGHYIDLDRIGL